MMPVADGGESGGESDAHTRPALRRPAPGEWCLVPTKISLFLETQRDLLRGSVETASLRFKFTSQAQPSMKHVSRLCRMTRN